MELLQMFKVEIYFLSPVRFTTFRELEVDDIKIE